MIGVPVIAPVEPLSVRPVGKAPMKTLKVYGDVPPDAVTVWLYTISTIPFGSMGGETDNVGLTMVNVKSWLVARLPAASLDLTLK